MAVIGLIAVPSSVLVYQFAGLPRQPKHAAMARVVAITAGEGRFDAHIDHIGIRNDHGIGQFSMPAAEDRCQVGDMVPVEQRGVTLLRSPKTCR